MIIGFIGVGAMGNPMAQNLLKNGYKVNVYDLVPEQVKNLVELGAVSCPSGTEVARNSDLVITSLPNAKIVESVMTGPEGVIANCKPGTVIMDMSSVAPSTTQQMAKIASKAQVHYIDAPVSGGVAGASAGTLTIMVGCEPEIFDQIQPVLNVLGKNIFHVGPAGAGDAIKIVNNLLLGCNMAALAEALVLGVKCGLSPETMRDVIKVSSGRSYAFEAKVDKFILANQFNGGFAVDLQFKDLGLALDAGKDVSTPLPMTALATQVFGAARAKGLNKQDISSVIKVWEDLTGVEVRSQLDEA
jgi:2-hydroxymethylglutarate dehydrogenase